MELKEFVKKVILDLDKAISEANQETSRKVSFRGVSGQRTALEFDVAVTVETSTSKKKEAGIKVWGMIGAGGVGNKELKNSTVSRVSFGVHIDEVTKMDRASEDMSNIKQLKVSARNPAV